MSYHADTIRRALVKFGSPYEFEHGQQPLLTKALESADMTEIAIDALRDGLNLARYHGCARVREHLNATLVKVGEKP